MNHFDNKTLAHAAPSRAHCDRPVESLFQPFGIALLVREPDSGICAAATAAAQSHRDRRCESSSPFERRRFGVAIVVLLRTAFAETVRAPSFDSSFPLNASIGR
uniref:Uncharacterized protein n=1 Tax=Steinernema glaseri TaxID=37863 RepID=A0A1I7YX73_9BILA